MSDTVTQRCREDRAAAAISAREPARPRSWSCWAWAPVVRQTRSR